MNVGAPQISPALIACLGDVMPGQPISDLVEQAGVRAVADRLWAPVDGSSAVVANLEGPVRSRGVPVTPGESDQRIDPKILDVFDPRFLLGLANNHIMDFGIEGLEETIAALDEAMMPHAGAGLSLDDAARPARLHTSTGFTIALVAGADARSVLATPTSPGVCPARPEILRDAIGDARRGADTVIASIHTGIEHCAAPSRAQVDIAEVCLDAGASLVVIHHSHCLGGFRRGARGATILGAGNYLFPPRVRQPAHWFRGAVWEASYDPQTRSLIAMRPRPVVLDAVGIPELATGSARERTLSHIERWSRRAVDGPRGTAWRIVGMLHPGFLSKLVSGFGGILLRQGPVGLWRSGTRSTSSHRGMGRSPTGSP